MKQSTMTGFQTAAAIFLSATWAFADSVPLSYLSPDGALKAVVIPTGRDAGATRIDYRAGEDRDSPEYECRVEIRTLKGRLIWQEDFSSPDHDHGRGVAFALWSPDSRYFVFSTDSSGGHHPWQFFTYAYSRSRNALFLLDSLIGEVIRQKFAITPPDIASFTILDRSVKDSTKDFPSRKVTISLDKTLAHKAAAPQGQLVNPPFSTLWK